MGLWREPRKGIGGKNRKEKVRVFFSGDRKVSSSQTKKRLSLKASESF